ncbi:MAG: adenylyl-sulfate kinase [Bacteroidales bacterium]|nr:adenylyl-sulfate kinase [Bacteroidales bacterium]
MAENQPTQLFYHAGSVTRDDRRAVLHQSGATLWFTGLSGSGKSTLAIALEQELIRQRHAAYVLDGDNIRFGLNASPQILRETRQYSDAAAKRFGLTFSAEDRVENIRRISETAKLFADAGLFVLTSFISPYRNDRAAARIIHEQSKTGAIPFIEVYCNTPIATCEQRDPKGLYKQARAAVAAGNGIGFTGIDAPYEPPTAPELTYDASTQTIADGVAAIIRYLTAHGLLVPGWE